MAAPEQQQQIEIVESGAEGEMRFDRGGRRLRAGQAPVALGAPVSELCEGPRHAERVPFRGAHRRAVRVAPVRLTRGAPGAVERAVHADREQVIVEVPAWHAAPYVSAGGRLSFNG